MNPRHLFRSIPVSLAPAFLARCTLLLCGAALSLTACGRADDDPASGGLTVGESDRLDAAAQRLDSRDPAPGQADSAALEKEIGQRLEQENGAISAR